MNTSRVRVAPVLRWKFPITATTFVLIYKKLKDTAQTKTALNFFTWALEQGQPQAQELDYVSLPASLVNRIRAYGRRSAALHRLDTDRRGIAAGFAIGVIASLLGVAGGEFLIPTLVLLFGTDVKLAGSLSLAVSLPTMLVGFTRYSRDQSFGVLRKNWSFLLVMAVGSMIGTLIGGLILGVVPTSILLPLLAAILVISAVKVWRHQ